jgi:6-pyruvoyltetrahydropterin/6-carboxytetrahydropterin synthase
VQFAAAHFATFRGGCEPLHGHSYTVAASIEGELAREDAWVVDFVLVKSILRDICDELDHRFILQRESRILQIEDIGGAWRVATPDGASYILPAQDVVPLPLDNSTAERIAEWLCERLWRELEAAGADNLQSATVDVGEGPEQFASYRRERLPLS